ncbi:MAG: TolC family protein, partial [Myxococcota bacterium]
LPPELAAPGVEAPALLGLALRHPELAAARSRVDASEGDVTVARSQRLPSANVRADWIVTDPALDPSIVDSGKDAVAIGLGVRLPLWQRIHGAQVRAAEATATEHRAVAEQVRLALTTSLDEARVRVTDSVRHVTVVQHTLLPLAKATYSSLLGSYAVGDATVAQVLLAQRDLLELQVEEQDARAAHAVAWADLDERCGTDVPRQRADDGGK